MKASGIRFLVSKGASVNGKHADMAKWVCRGEAKAGTTRFIRIATIHVLRPGPRVTLAMVLVKPGMSNAAVITGLVHPVRMARVRLSRLWLDRGFASVDVVQRLQDLRLSAVTRAASSPSRWPSSALSLVATGSRVATESSSAERVRLITVMSA
ncbi:MAG: hypothetical protein ABI780_13540 [Ardenticatenales bacterium]